MTEAAVAPAPQGNPNPDPTPPPAPPEPPPSGEVVPPISAAPPEPPAPEPPAADTWREQFATKRATVDGKLDQAAHDKLLNRLKRFSSVDDALEAFFNADKKIADGSYKKPPSEKATAEELAEYRKANGIPDAPEGYLAKLPDGLVIGDEDKPIVEKFVKAFHDKHAEPGVVHAAIKAYYDLVDEQEGLRQQQNVAAKAATDDEMHAEWGADYRPNINLISAFVGSMPEDLRNELYQSTKPDGTQIMNNPAMLRWLAQQARELNYTGAVLPTGQADVKGLDQEIAALEKASGDKNSSYWRGQKHPSMKGETIDSARLLELYDIRSKLGARKAG